MKLHEEHNHGQASLRNTARLHQSFVTSTIYHHKIKPEATQWYTTFNRKPEIQKKKRIKEKLHTDTFPLGNTNRNPTLVFKICNGPIGG